MYIQSIEFKREQDSKWENGYYIGKYENCDNSVFLDENYKPILDKNEKLSDKVWDYHGLINGVCLDIPEVNSEDK